MPESVFKKDNNTIFAPPFKRLTGPQAQRSKHETEDSMGDANRQASLNQGRCTAVSK